MSARHFCIESLSGCLTPGMGRLGRDFGSEEIECFLSRCLSSLRLRARCSRDAKSFLQLGSYFVIVGAQSWVGTRCVGAPRSGRGRESHACPLSVLTAFGDPSRRVHVLSEPRRGCALAGSALGWNCPAGGTGAISPRRQGWRFSRSFGSAGKRSRNLVLDTQGIADPFFLVFAATRFGGLLALLGVNFFPGWITLFDGVAEGRGGNRGSLFISVIALRGFYVHFVIVAQVRICLGCGLFACGQSEIISCERGGLVGSQQRVG